MSTQILVPLNKLHEHPENVRTTYDERELEELADSIAQVGLLSPLLVYGGVDGSYNVLAGHRRRRALQILVERKVIKRNYEVPCLTQGEQVDDGDATVAMLVENLQRTDLTPIEEAKGYSRMTEQYGYTQRDLAAKVGKSPGHIAKRMALLQLSEDVQKLIDDRITIEQAYRLSCLDEDQIKKLTKEILKGRGGDNFDYDLRSAEMTRDKRRESEKFRKLLDKLMIEPVKDLPTTPEQGREFFDWLGYYRADTIKDYVPKQNHVQVAGAAPITEISVYRKLTAKQVAANKEKAIAANKAYSEEHEAAEQRWLAEEATPYEIWQYRCEQLDEEYREKADEYSETIRASLGGMLLDLPPREVGKVALALVATKGLNYASQTCGVLGLHPPTEDAEGRELSSWRRDWDGTLRAWIGDDTSRAIIAWVAASTSVDNVNELDVFKPFREQLSLSGIVAPKKPDMEDYGPEPWYDDETETWRTDLQPDIELDEFGLHPSQFSSEEEYSAAWQTMSEAAQQAEDEAAAAEAAAEAVHQAA